MEMKPMAAAVAMAYGRKLQKLECAWVVQKIQVGKGFFYRMLLPDVWGRFA